ncbi:glycerophosphodiester phosphodiesterase [Subtercola sp. Z020]|uniref:glycerophosphodiester phosphodiesterase family protein n=1 Tax=Subtercola sp. Z020 TaxID=2080582 RepID=UPI000CE7DE0B|nr:glycerophosphodiester phosphodiesterase family protein [Subtercola sp. Z020]PPF85555.1 glycerophosphodiester phosphodiesterase [Subtercola sp. Z020]
MRRAPTRDGQRAAGYFSPPLPRLLAHRGLATEHIENTLPAFRAAVDRGATYVECDVHCSSDGIAMVAHDPDLKRLLGVDGAVEQYSAASLGALDLGEGVGFPSLLETLRAFPHTRFNIDVKSQAAALPAAGAILAASAADRVLVTSFSDRRRTATVNAVAAGSAGGLRPATSASARTLLLALVAATLRLGPAARWLLRNVDAVQAPETALRMRVTAPRVLSIIHSAGVEVHIWTVNDPERMRELLALGVEGIITDRVDIALSPSVTGNPKAL